VNKAIEDGIGDRRNADHVVLAIDRSLTGDEVRAEVHAILDDFEEIPSLLGREHFRAPKSSQAKGFSSASSP
jgi:hypothetical protein